MELKIPPQIQQKDKTSSRQEIMKIGSFVP